MTSKFLGLGAILAALFFGFSPTAHATLGELACIADTPSKQKLEIVFIFEENEQTISFIDVKLDGTSLVKFPESAITDGYKNVGTEENPFMNYHQWADDGTNKLTLRYPEQDPDGAITIYATVYVPKTELSEGLSLKEIEINCY